MDQKLFLKNLESWYKSDTSELSDIISACSEAYADCTSEYPSTEVLLDLLKRVPAANLLRHLYKVNLKQFISSELQDNTDED